MKSNILKRVLREGERYPLFPYMIGYTDWSKLERVYYLFPLNFLIQFALLFNYLWRKIQNKSSFIDYLVSKKCKGYRDCQEEKVV